MTQPVSSSFYTPYEPDLDRCSAEETKSNGNTSNGGAEGAGATPNAQPASEGSHDCTAEALATTASCAGAAYLLAKGFSPPALFAAITCAANAMQLNECLSEPETKTQGR